MGSLPDVNMQDKEGVRIQRFVIRRRNQSSAVDGDLSRMKADFMPQRTNVETSCDRKLANIESNVKEGSFGEKERKKEKTARLAN